ncbi:hypothetical protein GXW77_16370 [Roseomonas alkaliterrae]|uniref:Argininosuccinate lyase n=1 Tax=Neoroseomonas alkaliterrae TaxID=1452450 RepID=A0A840Y412_9PROT|nr:hypothetical protein [Neoroseomonas alkaliterrae]MBB5690731.1 hypothetical protein [Neoroseomonas alkaliterrae]MBR0677751.1 hypothetical protein [Neoroseomonas alkaliterrae]
MTCAAALRILAPVLLLAAALAACGDRASERGGLGPRGTALPPPDPVTGAERTALPGREAPALRR